ncbi:MAG: hypothetical protein RTU09_09300 [Candidatus Thorarchaeota archaeon]
MSSDEKDETYWLGVRDALRMVDSFVRWSARHEGKAKNLQEFISEGLIAAAKRCESCLSTTLGLTFGESLDGLSSDDLLEPADPTDRLPTHYEEPPEEKDSVVPDDESPDTEDLSPEPKFESEPETSAEVEPTSIEAIERTEDTEIDDMQLEGPSRDFGTDFELGEPSPLTIEPEVEDQESTVSEDSEPVEPPSELEHIDVIEDEVDDPSPSTEAGLTWSEYERATTPPETIDTSATEEHETEPSKEPTEWRFHEESMASEDGEAKSPEEADKETLEVEPPPPPPPPESDESEEERRRRARRLFFGT